jgi:very-short-patch-repair endonuclease
MNAVEIEEAVSILAEAPFVPEEFPFAFLEAFGNKPTTLKKLKSGSSNQSDLPGGVLQRNHIHLKVCAEGEVTATLKALRQSGATTRQKAKFILATDGKSFEAENLVDGETVVCVYPDFHNYFGFFLPLAGITTVKQIRENAFDIKATGRLNRLYVELLKENPDWDMDDRREEMNHFMARLIFCFFAEDTNIFHSEGLFTNAIAQMSASDSSNTHEVLSEVFRAMCTLPKEREAAGIRNWANEFPYVNGGLFSPHPLAPSPRAGEGGKEMDLASLSQGGRGSGGEGQGEDYWEISPALKQKMTEVARQFRREPTPTEGLLWQALRGRKLAGRKFRRQQPIGAFIVDFFCGTERLIVEVDGPIHDSQQEADRQRQELLESLGLKVVRVTSELVETSLDKALDVVRQAFDPHPLTPSPREGEGGQEQVPAPLSQLGRGVGGEGIPVPRFSKIARSYLLHVGSLDWKQINPDIFGSMIQAVADEEERGALGMHYTSVPNILKVLNPLFLDDLRTQLEAAGDNGRKLLNLRSRMARIRVFDPACGSGNFLVIAYKEMRAIEAEINQRRGESDRRSEIPLTNFRGIEIRHFAAEIARLALVIAEYQCNVVYLGQQEARSMFLPLKNDNWITCGNALRLDWLSLCPPTGTGVKLVAEDLFSTPLEQTEIDFENEGGETYICGNPPYKGSQTQTKEQKSDLDYVFKSYKISSKQIDYVGGWFVKAAEYAQHTVTEIAFVSTNSICQGRIVPILWPVIFEAGSIIRFAYTSFKWANLASHNAGVTVSIVCLSRSKEKKRYLFDIDRNGEVEAREASNITPYLTAGENIIVTSQQESIVNLHNMSFGNMPVDGGNLLLSAADLRELDLISQERQILIRRIYGSAEFIRGLVRYCLWIKDEQLQYALGIEAIRKRIDRVREMRLASKDVGTNKMATRSHQMREMNIGTKQTISMPCVSSESRDYLPVGLIDNRSTVTNLAFALYDAPLWNMALIASRLHLVWIATVCGKLETRYRYSNTLGWNTFPVPTLTEQNKADLTRCAEDILLAREQYFPATIADMYDPTKMDADFPLVREAHDRNDETLERIYIGRRFKNDTERLEKLFEMYTKMTSKQSKPKGSPHPPAPSPKAGEGEPDSSKSLSPPGRGI